MFLKQVLICEDKKKYIAAKSIQCGIQLIPWVKPAYHYIAVGEIGYLSFVSKEDPHAENVFLQILENKNLIQILR